VKLSDLTEKKVGGIPVVYIAVIVAGIALYGAIRLKPAATDTADTGDTVEGDQGGEIAIQPVFVANKSQTVTSDDSGFGKDTNEYWGRRAIEWLTANGTALPLATSAITGYLDGTTLSYAEGVVRDKAIHQFGLPPEGLLSANTNKQNVYNGPASKQGVPPLHHVIKGTMDNTAKELARLYYGIDNTDAIILIHQANPTLTTPYPVGSRVLVPAFHQPRYYTATTAINTLYAIAKKNGMSPQQLQAYNPNTHFPVEAGHRVRVR